MSTDCAFLANMQIVIADALAGTENVPRGVFVTRSSLNEEPIIPDAKAGVGAPKCCL
jgi:hypothetical protein